MSKDEATQDAAPAIKGPKMAKKVEGLTREGIVTVIATTNPKREGSAAYDRFEYYFTLDEGTSVQSAIDAGLTIGDIRFDLIAGSIEITDAEVVEYEVTPRGEKKEVVTEDSDEAEAEADLSEDEGF